MSHRLSITALEDRFAVCRLPPDAPFPDWAWRAPGFVSITRSAGELSVIVREDAGLPDDVLREPGWRAFELGGPFAFTLTGVLASVLDPLRDAGIGILAVSTYDTDHVLVKDADFARAVAALERAGHAAGGLQ